MRWRGPGGAVEVMRGEETQLLGALALAGGFGEGGNGLGGSPGPDAGHGGADGGDSVRGRVSSDSSGDGSNGCHVFILPGTHSKSVEVRAGRIERFATYLTGELFALLTTHGTLALLSSGDGPTDAPHAFADGVALAGEAALSNALFACRARVVGGDLPAADSRSFLSGVLIGAEWHDALRRVPALAVAGVTLVGAAALAERHAAVAAQLGVAVRRVEPHDAHVAALGVLRRGIDAAAGWQP